MSELIASKTQTLKANGSFNPYAQRVRDRLFQDELFFDPCDLLQVKYEMLRRVQFEGWTVTDAAAAFGFSRPSFYKAHQAFVQHGFAGLMPEKRGPKTAHKLTVTVMASVQAWLVDEPHLSSRTLARRLAQRLKLSIHPRSIERALQRQSKKRGLNHRR